jgi:hypothetical protein
MAVEVIKPQPGQCIAQDVDAEIRQGPGSLVLTPSINLNLAKLGWRSPEIEEEREVTVKGTKKCMIDHTREDHNAISQIAINLLRIQALSQEWTLPVHPLGKRNTLELSARLHERRKREDGD